MADTHRVILTAGALADLEAIAAHIRRDSPDNATAVAARIIDAIDSLAAMPTRFLRAGMSAKAPDAGALDGGTPVYRVLPRRPKHLLRPRPHRQTRQAPAAHAIRVGAAGQSAGRRSPGAF